MLLRPLPFDIEQAFLEPHAPHAVDAGDQAFLHLGHVGAYLSQLGAQLGRQAVDLLLQVTRNVFEKLSQLRIHRIFTVAHQTPRLLDSLTPRLLSTGSWLLHHPQAPP